MTASTPASNSGGLCRRRVGKYESVLAESIPAVSCDTDSAQLEYRPTRLRFSDSAEEHGCCIWSRREQFSGVVSNSSVLGYRATLG
jgi:hypothetical protein